MGRVSLTANQIVRVVAKGTICRDDGTVTGTVSLCSSEGGSSQGKKSSAELHGVRGIEFLGIADYL